MNSIAISSEVISAAVALAGLTLVYLGSIAASFERFNPQERKSVKDRFLNKAWFAFWGIVTALVAAMCGLLGKWLTCQILAHIAAGLLVLSFGWVVFVAFLNAREIK